MSISRLNDWNIRIMEPAVAFDSSDLAHDNESQTKRDMHDGPNLSQCPPYQEVSQQIEEQQKLDANTIE
jgi:hypothetical protein